MTTNQIEYQKHLETQRHNREMEAAQRDTITETGRHNLALESENYRSNVASEAIRRQTNAINAVHYQKMDAETQRANLAREYETQVHNRAIESETAAHNRATEMIQGRKASADISLKNRELEATEFRNAELQRQNDQRDFSNLIAAEESAARRQLLDQQREESKAREDWYRKTTETETSKQFLNYSTGANRIVDSGVKIIDVIKSLGGSNNGKGRQETILDRIQGLPVDSEGYYILD